MNINSKEYWNNRFASGDWVNKGGLAQSYGFMNALLGNLPEDIIIDLNKSNNTIADVGCGIATGTLCLSLAFNNCSVVGIDHSDEAIRINRDTYDSLEFKHVLDTKYTCIVSSNVLEHVDDPISYLLDLTAYCDKYLIVLVPYDEVLSNDEHIHSFKSLPAQVNSFESICTKLIKCDVWMFEQLLTIYENKQYETEPIKKPKSTKKTKKR